jgi:hypothetical protein
MNKVATEGGPSFNISSGNVSSEGVGQTRTIIPNNMLIGVLGGGTETGKKQLIYTLPPQIPENTLQLAEFGTLFAAKREQRKPCVGTGYLVYHTESWTIVSFL